MTIQTVHFHVKPDCIPQFENAVVRIVEALKEAQIGGVRYLVCRSETTATFTGTLLLDTGTENPLPTLQEGRDFLAELGTWLAAPPERAQWHLVSEYTAATMAGGER